MATLLQFEKVLLKCSCGIKSPIINLYFCKHCLKLRCGRCVSHEVDSYSCPNCLENMPSAEAKLKKNRCANCLDCPSCNHSLTTRATSVALTDSQSPDKKMTKKVYYLACGLCRWTSRDIGLADKESASGGWEEYENNHAVRLNNLLEYYHQLAIKEKNEREQKKFTKRRTYLRLQEKYFSPGGLATRRKTSFLSALSSLAPKTDEPEVTPISKIEPSEEVDPLPSKYYTQPLVLEKVTTLAQRLNRPEFASSQVEGLYPRHKHLVIKRSQRCRECEHNLSKPEYNPSSIKFKIQLVALQHIPDVRIYLVPKLHVDRESIVTILLSNPSQEAMEIQLEALNEPPSTGSLIVPSTPLVLAAKDITAEFDEKVADTSEYQDNPDLEELSIHDKTCFVVVSDCFQIMLNGCQYFQHRQKSSANGRFIQFRSGHKLGVLFKVTPQSPEHDIVLCFKLKHKYQNTSPSLRSPADEDSTPDATWLEHEVHINLGPTSP